MLNEFWIWPLILLAALGYACFHFARQRRLRERRQLEKEELDKSRALFEKEDGRRQRREANEEAIRRKALKTENKRVKNAERDEMRAIIQLFSQSITPHKTTLRAKYRQTVSVDEYGVIDRSRWDTEVRYFIDRVSDPEVSRWGKDKLGQSDYYYKIFGNQLEQEINIADIGSETAAPYDAQMTGIEFEKLVANRLTAAGAEVHFTPPTGDHGADLVAAYNDRTIVIQCKRSSTAIGNKAVQEVYSGCAFHGGHEAWVVSDAPFTRQAQQLATTLSVRLIDFSYVENALL